MEREELIEKMRARVKLCRNLAQSTSDEQTAKALRQIANEGERDLRKLESESAQIPPETPTAS